MFISLRHRCPYRMWLSYLSLSVFCCCSQWLFFKTICFFNLLNGKVYSRNASFALNWISTSFCLHTCVYNYLNCTKLLRRGYRNMTSFLRYGVLSKRKTYLLYMHDVFVIIRLDCRNVLLVWYLFFLSSRPLLHPSTFPFSYVASSTSSNFWFCFLKCYFEEYNCYLCNYWNMLLEYWRLVIGEDFKSSQTCGRSILSIWWNKIALLV